MNKASVSVPHSLGQAEAERRIKGFLDKAQTQLSQGPLQAPGMPAVSGSLAQEWKDGSCEFTFMAQGQTLSGTVTVSAASVDVSAKIPLVAIMMKGKLESALAEGLAALLK